MVIISYILVLCCLDCSSTHSYACVDVLARFEIHELGVSGEYNPVPVYHNEGDLVGDVFMLQQGLQRRLRVTLICESGSEVHWKKVNELVIGQPFVSCAVSILV